MRLEKWPLKVVPDTDEEVAQAIGALLQEAGWAAERVDRPDREAVQKELRGWFDAGYSVDALLVAFDRKPDGSRQRRRSDRESLPQFLRGRMRAWRGDGTGDTLDSVAPPPRPGMPMAQWQAINQRNRIQSAPRPRAAPLGKSGEQARSEARNLVQRIRRDPIAKAREKAKRVDAAMDSLLLPGVRPTPVEVEQTTSHGEKLTGRLAAGYLGRQAIVGQNAAVRAILDRLRLERRGPTGPEKAVLVSAISGAKQRASLGLLEALTAELDSESAGILSDAGSTMQGYLDHAMRTDMSLDSMKVILDLTVQDLAPADEPPPNREPGHA